MPDPHDFHSPQLSDTRDELLRSSEGGYFGPGNAQLPAPPMLMMDRITDISMDGGAFAKAMSSASSISRLATGSSIATIAATP